MKKLINFLNKDVKDMNKLFLSMFFILTLLVVSFLSYKVNSSYALFSDEVTGKETINITYKRKDKSTVLYSDGTLIINERVENHDKNIKLHKSILKEYEAFSEQNKYNFNIEEEKWPLWYMEKDKIKQIEIDEKISPENTSYWFSNIPNLERVNLTNLDYTSLLYMNEMFKNSGSMFTVITNLVIPKGAYIKEAFAEIEGLKANIIIKGEPENGSDAFKGSGINENGEIILNYNGDSEFIKKMIKYYGPEGITSRGNIIKGN